VRVQLVGMAYRMVGNPLATGNPASDYDREMSGTATHQIIPLGENLAFLSQLAVWQHAEWGFLRPGERLEDRRRRLEESVHTPDLPKVWIAVRGNLLLGSAALYSTDFPDEPGWTPWLAAVLVARPFRGQGLGQALVAHVEQQASELGYDQCYLFTENARDFYLRLGWEEIGVRKMNDIEVVLMKKWLSCH